MKILFFLAVLISFFSCKSPDAVNKGNHLYPVDSFKYYWYDGLAEVNIYGLDQSRYGEARNGHSVAIFVTEDFYKDRQVKADQKSEKAVNVLKLNFTRQFNTGIYQYNTMESTFSPVQLGDHPLALKHTASIQEWCGQVFNQYNLRDKEYQVKEFSYFASEGDSLYEMDAALIELDLWNKIRINPEAVPEGDITMIPSSYYLRTAHKPLRAYEAFIKRECEGKYCELNIAYKDIPRKVTLWYRNSFPYEIDRWSEIVNGDTTTANMRDRVMIDYWNRNANVDSLLRLKLGL